MQRWGTASLCPTHLWLEADGKGTGEDLTAMVRGASRGPLPKAPSALLQGLTRELRRASFSRRLQLCTKLHDLTRGTRIGFHPPRNSPTRHFWAMHKVCNCPWQPWG